MGANDGIVSTASLVVGVAAAETTRGSVIVAGVAGLVAGAMSMAAGEYVSVSSQADTENADLARERKELASDGAFELEELTEIYVKRGLDKSLARQVAEQLMAHDALGAHARDELGISEQMSARPVQAAMASAATFAVGAALPLGMVFVSPEAFHSDGRLDHVARIPLASRGRFRVCRWCTGGTSDGTRHFLGSARDGRDCSNRRAAWSLNMIAGCCQRTHCRRFSVINRGDNELRT